MVVLKSDSGCNWELLECGQEGCDMGSLRLVEDQGADLINRAN